MAVEILAVGRLKDPPLETLCQRYVDRLARLLPTTVTEVRSLDALRQRAFGKTPRVVILLDERGTPLTSRGLADWLDDLRQSRPGHSITLCLGDAHGFSDEDRQRAHRVLRLSDFTLPHRLARLLLLEQLYRAATIAAGHPYHHD